MNLKDLDFLTQLARHGVVHRDEIKNARLSLRRLLVSGYVEKVPRRGKVFYALTPASLPLLEHLRKSLFERAQLLARLPKSSKNYRALVEDVRFLDEDSKAADEFLFLGDWQLKYPVVPSRLELSQYRYYDQRGLFKDAKKRRHHKNEVAGSL